MESSPLHSSYACNSCSCLEKKTCRTYFLKQIIISFGVMLFSDEADHALHRFRMKSLHNVRAAAPLRANEKVVSSMASLPLVLGRYTLGRILHLALGEGTWGPVVPRVGLRNRERSSTWTGSCFTVFKPGTRRIRGPFSHSLSCTTPRA